MFFFGGGGGGWRMGFGFFQGFLGLKGLRFNGSVLWVCGYRALGLKGLRVNGFVFGGGLGVGL